MTKSSSGVTELEGAVLSEIHHRRHDTAFQVRRAFQTSPSIEWSGSAGAVYPAIRRLTDAGLIGATPIPTGRRGVRLTLSAEGVAALEQWICDPVRAASVGVDPFRLRAGLWDTLDRPFRDEALRRVESAIDKELKRLLVSLDALDPVERTRTQWSIDLQRLRLRWLNDQLEQKAAR